MDDDLTAAILVLSKELLGFLSREAFFDFLGIECTLFVPLVANPLSGRVFLIDNDKYILVFNLMKI